MYNLQCTVHYVAHKFIESNHKSSKTKKFKFNYKNKKKMKRIKIYPEKRRELENSILKNCLFFLVLASSSA